MLHCRQSRRLCVFIVCSLGPEICFSTQLVTSSNSFFEGFVICTEPLLRDGSLCNNLPSGLEKQPERVIVKRGEPLLLNCILNRFFALDSRELPQKNITWIKNGLPNWVEKYTWSYYFLFKWKFVCSAYHITSKQWWWCWWWILFLHC